MLLADLEQANISFMPNGRGPDNDRGPRDFGGKRFSRCQGAQDWGVRRWHVSYGIQVYTGIPSEQDGAQWHDLNFKYEALCAAPDAVLACVDALVNAVPNPLLTLSKSGGLRFSCRVPDYLHPNTESEKQYIYKHTPMPGNPHQRNIYLEILGEDEYTRWDARYEILLGNLLDPPVVAKEVLFAPIDALRAELHQPGADKIKQDQVVANAPLSLGSNNLDLAKEAFIQHDFSYVRQENGCHHWRQLDRPVDDEYVLLWESDNIVWVRASTPTDEFPTEATPITEVWGDTGILPPAPGLGIFVSDEMIAVQDGKLSPLAVKRPPAVLHKSECTQEPYQTPESHAVQTQNIFDGTARILGLVTRTDGGNHEAASYLLDDRATCLNVPVANLAEKAEQYYQSRNISSFTRWKTRMHQWEQVKAIPADGRMATPFQRGNVCEDPERCEALEKKGGNPSESICPHCPVYTECQQRGYLSQPAALQRTKAQILAIPELFFNPQYAELVEKIFKQMDETERLGIIGRIQAHKLFFQCKMQKKLLEEWSVRWQGSALGNFAKALQHAIEIADIPHADAVKRIRTVIKSFEWQEEALVRQMCQVSVQGSVVERSTVDPETGQLLARFAIKFENGISAYVPLDDNAADRLKIKGTPFFRLSGFAVNEDMKIMMSMTQAIRLGILDTSTVERIQEFPTACPDPSWTYWHQLKRFFAHYSRDADAPIRWGTDVLRFWLPPLLHPSIKRLLLMSVTFSERHIRRAFPHEDIQACRSEPTSWIPGNRVFQIRTGVYPKQTILGYNNNADVVGISKTGQRFFAGIRSEIERDPSVKHAIITYKSVISWLSDIAKKDNVSFVTNFDNVRGLSADFRKTQVIWIIGTPQWLPSLIWRRAQILFGDDKEPLFYEKEIETGRYKDERIQDVYEQGVVRVLTRTIHRTGLERWADRTVVLISSLAVPDITDRPETLLFDWEDFEIAGGLHELPEVIATRERFEAEREKLTVESSREEVERVLGCSSRQANRVLREFRGGAPLRVPFRKQILVLLADGEKRTAELVAAIEGHPKAVKNELKRLVDTGEIVRVRWGIYALPKRET
ncbi:hypothetical protein F4Z99_07540 [Candidatus Poribacteria bacterium]|nr:hypothetical protein [Candidatus Poribacteria bacterium]